MKTRFGILVVFGVVGCTSGSPEDDKRVGALGDGAATTEHDSAAQAIGEASWKAMTGLQFVEHEIQERTGCDLKAVPAEYPIRPDVTCTSSATVDTVPGTVSTPAGSCRVEAYCTRHADCGQSTHGLCLGAIRPATCWYDLGLTTPLGLDADRDLDSDRICLTDEDCDALPGGKCENRTTSPAAEDCQQTRICRCLYRAQPCETDSDCIAGPNGRCLATVQRVHCQSFQCLGDADCAPSERCDCQRCVPADCKTDADCGDGRLCRADRPCWDTTAFHCSTPNDDCTSHEDCPADETCQWMADRWACAAPSSCHETP